MVSRPGLEPGTIALKVRSGNRPMRNYACSQGVKSEIARLFVTVHRLIGTGRVVFDIDNLAQYPAGPMGYPPSEHLTKT